MKKLFSSRKDILRTYGEIEEIRNSDEYKEFTNHNEVHQWGMDTYGEWGKAVKEFEEKKRKSDMFKKNSWAYLTLGGYCVNEYEQINKFYINDDYKIDDTYNYKSIRLSEQLLEAPGIPENIVVYRFVENAVIEKIIDANKNNCEHYYEEKGFMSTSLLKTIVEDRREDCSLLKIYVDKGTVGAYVDVVASRGEHELLLQNNLNIRLCNVPYLDKEYNVMVYECKALSHYANIR